MGIYYTQHSPPSELLANVLPHETYSADVIVLKFESLSSRCLCLWHNDRDKHRRPTIQNSTVFLYIINVDENLEYS